MPKETFFNLPDEKRRMIEDVATDEFVKHGYDRASINRIVAECKIAKGSFYQYFEDKKDLFKHLLSSMAQGKMKYITPELMNPADHDFFILIREIYLLGLRYAKDNPKVVIMANQVLKNKDHAVYNEAVAENIGAAYDMLTNLLNNSINKGVVRPNINTKFVSYMIASLNLASLEYYFEVVKGKKTNLGEVDDDIIGTVDLFVDFIRNGIGISETGGNNDD